MTTVNEIAPELYRISVYAPAIDLQFNHFLVKDDEPLLYHTGTRAMFAEVHAAVAKIIDPARIRWISASHFEADEWGALNQWLQAAPSAQAVCGITSAQVNLNDYASRAPHGLVDNEVLSTGKYRFRFRATPHLPHGWDAGLLFEETEGTLFCSDLFFHNGEVRALTQAEVIGPARRALLSYQDSPLLDVQPYTLTTERQLQELAQLQPRTLALMHGSAFAGDGAGALRDLAGVMQEAYAVPRGSAGQCVKTPLVQESI